LDWTFDIDSVSVEGVDAEYFDIYYSDAATDIGFTLLEEIEVASATNLTDNGDDTFSADITTSGWVKGRYYRVTIVARNETNSIIGDRSTTLATAKIAGFVAATITNDAFTDASDNMNISWTAPVSDYIEDTLTAYQLYLTDSTTSVTDTSDFTDAAVFDQIGTDILIAGPLSFNASIAADLTALGGAGTYKVVVVTHAQNGEVSVVTSSTFTNN